MYIGMYVYYVLYIFLNLIMSIIPALYFFVEYFLPKKIYPLLTVFVCYLCDFAILLYVILQSLIVIFKG